MDVDIFMTPLSVKVNYSDTGNYLAIFLISKDELACEFLVTTTHQIPQISGRAGRNPALP